MVAPRGAADAKHGAADAKHGAGDAKHGAGDATHGACDHRDAPCQAGATLWPAALSVASRRIALSVAATALR